MATKKPENLSFEQALEELTVIVTDMEQGDLSLEQSLKQFERGIALANASSSKLQQAEQKVAILMGNDPQSPLTDFKNDLD
ncbi:MULTISPECIES: exodeoxyribonuclease VII small subunit [unclassified Pseudoalteromonas]|uniref:exodeoxyribonuclease VII small subunit n=1 Tax=unclassified Pseudoalteromonas TaxID=194690 RepID=UPI000C06BCF3|nr:MULTISPECIES: exodeoxyribonuclease VII small subunit [unclassified Pseudoalteromonas]MDP2634423.1 exodeoxyribonuclease VII small subunit [Pseudoalteromonas sp. 1_MG-2023]PHN88142.1 exodeoxyribonuclease VII small subunit [Pseudoalteromonas sp. 3D05]TGE77687.1 exodeoxyribonuclease VII small subunit [Pseudoalteromonas sp. KS88]